MFVLWFRETDFCRNYCFFVIKILFTNDLRARVQSCFTCFRPFEILWTVASQAPLSIGFSKQAHWSGLHFLPQGILLTQGLNPGLRPCKQMLYHLSHQGSSLKYYEVYFKSVSSSFKNSVVFDSATPWTVAYQASLSIGLSRQEY